MCRSVVARERGPENTGPAAALTRRPWHERERRNDRQEPIPAYRGNA